MQANVRIEGMPELQRKIEKLKGQLDNDKVEPILLDSAKRIVDVGRQNTPVGPTGNLKKSWVAKQLKRLGDNAKTAIAAIDRKKAPHAHLVEFGTVKMSARPFFRPTVDGELPKEYKKIEQDLKKQVESV